MSTGTAVTVEKNPKVLDVNTFDLEFEIDPLFRNTSAAFDDGGVDALLFSHLTVRYLYKHRSVDSPSVPPIPCTCSTSLTVIYSYTQ